jgi:hypothetical protein
VDRERQPAAGLLPVRPLHTRVFLLLRQCQPLLLHRLAERRQPLLALGFAPSRLLLAGGESCEGRAPALGVVQLRPPVPQGCRYRAGHQQQHCRHNQRSLERGRTLQPDRPCLRPADPAVVDLRLVERQGFVNRQPGAVGIPDHHGVAQRLLGQPHGRLRAVEKFIPARAGDAG